MICAGRFASERVRPSHQTTNAASGSAEVLVGEGGAPEQEHRVGGIDKAGDSRNAAGSRHLLCHQEETATEQNACRTDHEDARHEGAEAGEVYEARRDRGQPRVVGSGWKQRVEFEKMSGAKDVLGIPQMDELVGQCERVGRPQDLDEIEGDAEKDERHQPFPSIGVLSEYHQSNGNEDEKQAEPEEHRRPLGRE